ncbi:MAG: glycosyltransferase, partial [Candidatus Limnocylindria bacterium]
QGLVLAEALAAGVPVVAVEGHGVRDSVRAGIDGLVVEAQPEAGRVARLGAGLLGLARDEPLRREMAAAALRDAHRFDVRARIGQVEALYHDLLAGRQARRRT